jgi:hypothetical protein
LRLTQLLHQNLEIAEKLLALAAAHDRDVAESSGQGCARKRGAAFDGLGCKDATAKPKFFARLIPSSRRVSIHPACRKNAE